jgi:membrane-associated phospholipid phosphatase
MSGGWPNRGNIEELRMLDWLHRRTPQAAVPLARAATLLGETPVVWTAVGASALLAGARSGRWGPLLRPICTLAAAAAARRALAEVIDRRRPPARLWRAHWSGPSFPSRHTTLGTVGAGLVAGAVAPGPGTRAVACSAAVLVGLSRLVLGVHWPSDVVAGWVFGAATLEIAAPRRPTVGDGQPHPDRHRRVTTSITNAPTWTAAQVPIRSGMEYS